MAVTITEAAELEEIDTAPRAVVLLTADYAYTGAFARRVFERVSEAFPHYFPGTDVRFFLLEEDGPLAALWLDRFPVPDLRPTPVGPPIPRGAGSVLFLHHGQLVQFCLSMIRLASEAMDPNIIVGFLAAREVAGVNALESEIVTFIRLTTDDSEDASQR
jgi:hypothetical protein